MGSYNMGAFNLTNFDYLLDLGPTGSTGQSEPPPPEAAPPNLAYNTDTDNNYYPTIDSIKDKTEELEEKMKLYQNFHDMIYRPIQYADEHAINPAEMDSLKAEAKRKINSLQIDIKQLTLDINTLISNILPKGDNNKMALENNVATLVTKNQEMQYLYDKLQEHLAEPLKLEGEYEVSKIKTKSIFFTYMFFLIFAIFIVFCLILIYKKPESGNLDMFILALAVIIFVYYLYQHYVKYNRSLRK